MIGRFFKAMGNKFKNENVDRNTPDKVEEMDTIVTDGGYAWVVCFGAFIVQFILDGTMFSFGVLLLELLSYFGQGKAKTAWVGSALLGMSMLMGPMVSVLLERFSCRRVTIGGALLSTTAFVVAIFSPNVEVLILTYGLTAGIGFCMMFISSIIVVGHYFHRKRAIATGIATSGSGLGVFVYAYLTNYLLNHFDWRGTILILSGILLNCVVCGAIFRPLIFKDCKIQRSVVKEDVKDTEKLLVYQPVINPRLNYLQNNDLPSRLAQSADLQMLTSTSEAPRYSSSHHNISTTNRNESYTRTVVGSELLKPMSRNDIFYSGSLARLPQFHDTSTIDTDSLAESADSVEDEAVKIPKCCSSVGNYCSLFKDKLFVLLLCVNVMWTVQSVPLTYIPDLAVSKHLDTTQAAMLISIVGITNIFGRVVSGIITDTFHIKSIVTYTFTLLAASLVNFLLPWCNSFLSMAVCSGVFGICMGSHVSMRTIVLVDYLGIEKLTKSFGMVALFQGITFMANAPLAGVLYEEFGSYVMPFNYAGIMYFFSGFICIIIQCITNRSGVGLADKATTIEICIGNTTCAAESDSSGSVER